MKGKKKSSKYYGVSWHRPNLKWVARIRIDGTPTHVGSFDDEREAARMVDMCLIKHHKDPRNVLKPKK
jgi:hypothetical protein